MSAEHNGHALEIEHPGPATYAKVAAILTIITIAEVGIFFAPGLQFMLVPLLSVMSLAKFALVVMFYMHLKFDHPIFTRILVGGAVIAFGVFLWVLALFSFSHPLADKV